MAGPTTFGAAAANRDQSWSLILTIEGVGDATSGQWRFCSAVPTYASGNDAYKPWLAEWPEVLSERADIFGGVPEAGDATFAVLDYNDGLTGRFAFDSTPAATLSAGLTASGTSVNVYGAANLTAGQLTWVGSECVLVSAIATNTLTLTRAQLGTAAVAHEVGDQLYASLPYARGREMRLYLAPGDGASSATEQLFASYFVDGLGLDQNMNVWRVRGKSTLKHLGRLCPRQPCAMSVDGSFPLGAASYIFAHALDTLSWPNGPAAHWPNDGVWYLIGAGELAHADVSGNAFNLTRGQLGTWAGDTVQRGSVLTSVLAAGDPSAGDACSFRYSPGPSPSSSRSSGTWTKTAHPIPVLLSILCSSYDSSDGLELANRSSAYGAYDALPVGYGLGVPASLIDWPSFMAVWQRTPHYAMNAFRYGDTAEAFAVMVAREFLKPFGWYLTITNGLISLVMPRLPSEGDTLTAWDSDVIAQESTGPMAGRPILGPPEQDMTAVASSVVFVTRSPLGADVRTVVTNTGFRATYGQRGYYAADEGAIEVPMRGVRESTSSGLAYELAERSLYRFRQPPWRIPLDTDVSQYAVSVGALVGLTVSELPNVSTGARGVVSMPATVLERALVVSQRGRATMRWMLLAYGGSFRSTWIPPSAIVTGVASNVATVAANRYTSSAATAGSLPTSDAGGFAVGDVLQLRGLDGSVLASGATQTVASVGTNTLTLSGNFGGALASGTLLVYSSSASALATQLDRFLYLSDRAAHTIGSTTRSAKRWADA